MIISINCRVGTDFTPQIVMRPSYTHDGLDRDVGGMGESMLGPQIK